MHRFVLFASVIALAAGAAACGGGAGSRSSVPSGILGPTATGDAGPGTVSADGGKGGGNAGSSAATFSLVMVTDANSDGQPNWADSVTFKVATTATTEPHVDLKCTQNGTVVLGATSGFYASYPWPWTQVMTLSSPSWQGGAANCTATLYYFAGRKNAILSTLSFTAQG